MATSGRLGWVDMGLWLCKVGEIGIIVFWGQRCSVYLQQNT